MAIRPTPAFLWRHPAHWLALGFGSGLSPKAPGTVGTLWGWLAWWPLSLWLTPMQQGVLIALATMVGWWACMIVRRAVERPPNCTIVQLCVCTFSDGGQSWKM